MYKGLFRRLGAVLVLLSIAACSSAPDLRERQATAMRMWQERCDTKAGVRIYRTVENVEGIFLMKLRARTNFDDQFALDDPYGHDSTGDDYIKTFLRGFYHQRDDQQAIAVDAPRLGYRYVEAIDPADGKRYRYTGRIEEPWQYDKKYLQGYKRFVMDKVPAPDTPPRYGVTYDDISTREERDYWIAGSSLKVIDLQTGEVMAERIGYMVDRAQGSQAGGRSPWLFAADYACPSFFRNSQTSFQHASSAQGSQTIDFVESVLKQDKD